MENNFNEIVKRKTKDELVRILINKEEYKQELVEEVEKELKVRDKVEVKGQEINIPIDSPSTLKLETPFGVYLAGVLLFVTGPIWLFVGFLQAGASTITDDSTLSILSMWNILFSILSIVFGIGILKGKKWGYDWGLGTSCINILWFSYNYADTGWMFFAFLVLVELIIFISLLKNKGFFTHVILDQNVTVITPNNIRNPELSIEER